MRKGGLGLGDAAHTGPLTSESHNPCSSQELLALRGQGGCPGAPPVLRSLAWLPSPPGVHAGQRLLTWEDSVAIRDEYANYRRLSVGTGAEGARERLELREAGHSC